MCNIRYSTYTFSVKCMLVCIYTYVHVYCTRNTVLSYIHKYLYPCTICSAVYLTLCNYTHVQIKYSTCSYVQIKYSTCTYVYVRCVSKLAIDTYTYLLTYIHVYLWDTHVFCDFCITFKPHTSFWTLIFASIHTAHVWLCALNVSWINLIC